MDLVAVLHLEFEYFDCNDVAVVEPVENSSITLVENKKNK